MNWLAGEKSIFINVASRRPPEEFARFGVERIEVLVVGPNEDSAARDHWRGDDVALGLEAPEQRAILGFERIDVRIISAEAHDAVGDRR